MKEGDIVVCVVPLEEGNFLLTEGKQYVILSMRERLVDIVNDIGEPARYLADRFRTLDQLREERLNDLGI
jgi:hypothetical protein